MPDYLSEMCMPQDAPFSSLSYGKIQLYFSLLSKSIFQNAANNHWVRCIRPALTAA
jgi:hypothetical protein